jgi:predicted ArsR family transcriptional regulator
MARSPDDLAGIAALAEPARRALYGFVARQPESVSRDEAAAGADVARHVAKFHLDKLVDEGLLQVEYRRPPGRSGPGAGRPAKRYRRSGRQLEVSVPSRRYELAGHLLAHAVSEAAATNEPVADTLDRAAAGAGRAWAAEMSIDAVGRRPARAKVMAAVADVLDAKGYEASVDRDGITLGNCPFHALATEHTELVCGMNLSLLTGLVSEIALAGNRRLEAVLDPAPGRCCVRLTTR